MLIINEEIACDKKHEPDEYLEEINENGNRTISGLEDERLRLVGCGGSDSGSCARSKSSCKVLGELPADRLGERVSKADPLCPWDPLLCGPSGLLSRVVFAADFF